MGSFSGTSEIVEAREEMNSVRYSSGSHRSVMSLSEKSQKLPVLKVGYRDTLEDDINQLFEAISIKGTSKGLGTSQAGASPFRKSALKKPITVGMSRSSGIGCSEPVTLKQALRDLCLSKASEMAAMKRSSKSTVTSGVLEAGRIKTLYNSVVVESSQSSPSMENGKGSVVEISLVPEESKSKFQKIREQVEIPKVSSLSKSAQCSPRLEVVPKDNGPTPGQNENAGIMSKKVERPKSEHEQKKKPIPAAPPLSSNTIGQVLEQEESTPDSSKATTKVAALKAAATKVASLKAGRKGRLKAIPSSNPANGNRVSKLSRSNSRSVKPIIRNKGLAKKKVKQAPGSATSASSADKGANGDECPTTKQLICERCHCTLNYATKESIKDSSTSQFASQSSAGSSNVKSGASKQCSTIDSSNRSKAAVAKPKKNMAIQEKSEFSQSSKSSQGEYSSSTLSDESNVSGSSCGNRPHMSKDVRWEAIRHVRMRYGVLSLRNFNLLKKLGCGDIGTVYLAELIGTNCLFAIKVMDNEFLALRKKMPRAQTEREILRMLDHPFLPTLFAQFTSDNLSCLVMEYCPGGDLHVLRQKQPGRVFPEPAARFYVAEVLLALEYLHMLGVVYRDLKPENILVREDGHIMLTDFDLSLRCTVNPVLLKSSSFNTDAVRISGPCTESTCVEPFCIEPSCQVPCFSPRFLPAAAKTRKLKPEPATQVRSLPQLIAEPTDARSNSFVGTHEYLAPEIIKGEGHGAAVDWWTFGVFLYELLYGRTPFKGSNNDETLANVVLQSLKFPETPLVSLQARDLIRGLLVKEPEYRFGSEKGAAEIKQHPFFEGLNWALIRCAIPPELPDFCDFDVPNPAAYQNKSKYLECKATGEHLEFEFF